MRVRSVPALGAYVAEQRERRGWTQVQLASTAGVTRDWVARFETGSRDVTLTRVLSVLRALDVDLDVDLRTDDD